MELKIKDRDYVADGAGGLVRVSGWDELLERVLFKLSVRRGSFALVPELGSKLHLLRREKGESRATAAKQYVAEALADEKGLFIQVGHMKRLDPGLQYAKAFKDEKMGAVTTYKGWYCDSIGRYTLTDNVMPVIYSSDAAKKPAGNPKAVLDRYYLLGHGSHLFDTAMYFMGPVRRVSARYVHEEGLHSWLIDCDFESGAIGTLDLTVAIAQQWHEGCEIYGTGGTVFAKTYNPWEFRSSEVSCFDKETELSTTPAAFDGQFYRRELEAFADTILNGTPCAGATADDGIMIMRALIATYRSVHEDGAWIDIADAEGEL